MTVVETIKGMIKAIPDGNANMRGRINFFVRSDELLEITPWLNQWNEKKEGKFNGRWDVLPREPDYFCIYFRATGM